MLRAGDLHRLVGHLLQIGGQRLVLRLGHRPHRRRVGMQRARVVLGDLVELVGDRRGHRELEPIHGALLDGQIDLAPDHGHRVGAERLEGLDEGRDRRDADRLTLQILGRLHGSLVREHAAEAPAAAVVHLGEIMPS